MAKTIKEVADSVAPCGFICALCVKSDHCRGCGTNGEVCPILECCKGRTIRGCWECNDFPCCECSFRGDRMNAFLQCAKEEGIEQLARYLLRNQKNGLHYHYDHTQGDYDGYRSVEEVLEVLRTGKANVSPYERRPRYQTEHFILRLVQEGDADDLLACYSNAEARRFFNSDNCDYGFHYKSLADMRLCIDRWLAEYRNKTFVRFAILGKKSGKAVGTVEMFARAKEDEHDNKVGVLRIDLLPAYEQKQYLAEILKIADDRFYEAFHVDQIITKAVPEALERRAALKASGYIPLESNKIPYAHYFFRINQDSPMR